MEGQPGGSGLLRWLEEHRGHLGLNCSLTVTKHAFHETSLHIEPIRIHKQGSTLVVFLCTFNPPVPSCTPAPYFTFLFLFLLQTLSSSSHSFFTTFPLFSSPNLNFLLSSSASLSLSDLLVSSSCDITGHCSPLGLDTRPRCQATAVKGLSVSVCAACACYVCVYVCL